jgi:hypothetical protein
MANIANAKSWGTILSSELSMQSTETFPIAYPGGVAPRRRKLLVCLVRLVSRDAAALRKFRTWIRARRSQFPVRQNQLLVRGVVVAQP